MTIPPLSPLLVSDSVAAALREDLGRAGDITSAATVPAEAHAEAAIASRGDGALAGLELAAAAFRMLDPRVAFEAEARDGDRVTRGMRVARITGPARAILSAERVALNFLGHLSGVASATRQLADAVAHTKAKITCTRKTTPGLRALEKHAVRCGGGSNHRFGLDDAILIKDNHIAIAGGVSQALARARDFVGHLVRIEIEVDTLEQLAEALEAGAEVVLLDNMAPDLLRQAVATTRGRAVLEASGTITLDGVAAVAESGVDYISSGWITHSARVLDLGLDIAIG